MLTCMPEDDGQVPGASSSDKVMAAAGLAVALILAAISIDLLRGGSKAVVTADDDG
jgi:hypothetical protein